MKLQFYLRRLDRQATALFLAVLLIAGIYTLAEGRVKQKNPPKQRGEKVHENQILSLSDETSAAVITDHLEGEKKMNAKTMARISPLPMSEMPEEWIKTLQRLPGAGLKGEKSPVNVFGTLLHSPRTMGSFLDYWVTSKLEMGLSGREQELIILRIGYRYKCNYVWKHHVPVAEEFGASASEIEALKIPVLPSVFSPREYALLVLTDEMVEHRTIREEAWSKWSPELKASEMVDLISLVSQYVFFSLLNNGIQIEVEEPLQKIPGF